MSALPSSIESSSSRYPSQIPGSTLRIGLRPKQVKMREASMNPRVKILAAVGATGTGKTWYGPIWAWDQARRRPGSDVIVVGRTFKAHINATIIPYVEDWLSASNTGFRTNHSDYVTYLANGSRIFYRSDEAPTAMESIHPRGGVWLDEAGLMQAKTWQVAQARASLYDAPIFVTSIPYRAGFLKDRIYDPYMAGDRSIVYIHLTWQDAPEFTPERIATIRASMPAHEFDRRYGGVWAKPFGMIYPLPDDDELLVDGFNVPLGWPMRELVPGFEIPEGWPLFAGADWGMTAPTAFTWGVLDPDDVLTIIAIYEHAHRTPKEHCDALKPLRLHEVDYAWGDPANPGEWATFAENGFPIDSQSIGTESLNAVRYGIGVVADRLQTSRLKVLQGCNDWLDRREAYLWALDPKSGGETLLDKPAPGPAEHLMDATRYLCVGLKDHRLARSEIVAPIIRRRRVG
jgi:hypothetical protein